MARMAHKSRGFRQHSLDESKTASRCSKSDISLKTSLSLNTTTFQIMSHKPHDTDIDSQGRKRIAVACQRCRKRKIKCEPVRSQGEGQACLACQIAKSSKCEFLRVNSGAIYCPPSETPNDAWTLPATASDEAPVGGGQVGHDIGQYAVSHPSQLATSTTRTPLRTGADPFGRAPQVPDNTPSSQLSDESATLQGLNGSDIYSRFKNHYGTIVNHGNMPPLNHTTFNSTPSSTWYSGPECVAMSNEAFPSQSHSLTYNNALYGDPAISHVEDSNAMQGSSSYFPGLSPLNDSLPSFGGMNDRTKFSTNPIAMPGSTFSHQALGYKSDSSYSTANSQYTPEADTGTWTPGTSYSRSDNAAGSIGPRGATEGISPTPSQPPPSRSAYTYALSLTSNALDRNPTSGVPIMNLSGLSRENPGDSASHITTQRASYGRPLSLDASFPSRSERGSTASRRSLQHLHDLQIPATGSQRILQPQPRRSSVNRPLLSRDFGVSESSPSKSSRRISGSSSSRHTRKSISRHT